MRSSGFDPVSVETLNRRLQAVTIGVMVVFTLLLLRLWFLQFIHGPIYRTQSENNRIHLQKIPPFRGMIFDRHGNLLVDNRPSYNFYIIPEDIIDCETLLTSLNALIGIDASLIRDRLKKAPRNYSFKPILIKKNISRDELAVIETNLFHLPGVMIQVEPQRNYIYGKFASHLIGYLGEISDNQLKSGLYPANLSGDLIGKSGVERNWQRYLNGSRGGRQVEVDAAGRILRVISSKPPVPGLNIALTIDKDLQLLAEKLLEDQKGAIVAMDPSDGEILALASSPAFDPNQFIGGIGRSEWEKMVSGKDFPLTNRVISGQYPPGSLFKIVVALAGLEEGAIDPEEEITCPGSYTLGNRSYSCWLKSGHGNVKLHRALVESCDVYFYKIGKRLGVDTIAYYARMFGLGKKTGIELDYEEEGLVPTSEWKLKNIGVPWQPGETISMSIGQSFLLVTPIQMARVISAIYNGGVIYQPKVIKWVGKKGKEAQGFAPTQMGQIEVKPENLQIVKDGLVGVVNETHGTGVRARFREIKVAGKTGTAQVVTLETVKEFEEEEEIPVKYRDHAWFVALAPVDQPKMAIAILIENAGHGGSKAAPIARELIKEYLVK